MPLRRKIKILYRPHQTCGISLDKRVSRGLIYEGNLKGKGGVMEAYCVKCRSKREMKDPKKVTLKNGRPATQGICPVCGTKMFRIGG